MSKKSNTTMTPKGSPASAGSVRLQAFIALLDSTGNQTTRIINALCGKWQPRWSQDLVTDWPYIRKGWVNVKAIRDANKAGQLLRMRQFGKKAHEHLCAALNIDLSDKRPRCPHCGQVWYSQNADGDGRREPAPPRQ